MSNQGDTRIEKDSLGEVAMPADALYGIHTVRALENFPVTGRPVHPALVRAFGAVKRAAARVNSDLGYLTLDAPLLTAVFDACDEMREGALLDHVVVDALQGGAGTSTNMNVNEVIANRALVLTGRAPGDGTLSPLAHINLHQSTNDTYPTALRLAAMALLSELEAKVVSLQEALQEKEKAFAHIVKVGRTEMQDAVLTTVGRQFGAWAEAMGRDRWRIYKCQERLRVVNLGGTAIGTGLGAPRKYIFAVVDALCEITGLPLARAENLLECTQNADVFAEVSGILCAHGVSMEKMANDLRWLSSGPGAGIGELVLEPRQVGSSIMPGKVNPVIPEAVAQVAMQVRANDAAVKNACAAGNLELNPFLPLVADNLLGNLSMLIGAASIMEALCIRSIAVNEERVARWVAASPALATALSGRLGYDTVAKVVQTAQESGRSIQEIVLERGLMAPDELEAATNHFAVCKLGD